MRSDEQGEFLALSEETVSIEKRSAVRERVRVRTETETIEAFANADLRCEEIDVRRVPVDREVDVLPQVRTEGETTIVPVIEEVLVVEKRLVLREEIHIRRRSKTESVEIPVGLRRQHAVLERIDPATGHAVREKLQTEEAMNMADYETFDRSGNVAGTTLTAFFDSRAEAETAVARLREIGVSEASIRLAGEQAAGATTAAEPREKGFFEALGELFMPDEDRYAYAEGLSRGGYLVTVTDVPPALYEAALDLLDDAGTIDIDERAETWRAEGWTGYEGARSAGLGVAASGAPAAFSGETTPFAAGVREDEVVPVVEEQLRVGKRDVSHGRVRVRSYVRETPISEQVDLTEERVEIERRVVDRPVTAGDDAFRERSIEAEAHGEEVVVSKEARVVEEIGLRRETDVRSETVSDTVRRTEVEIEDERDDLPPIKDDRRT